MMAWNGLFLLKIYANGKILRRENPRSDNSGGFAVFTLMIKFF